MKTKITNILFYPSECGESFVVLELDSEVSKKYGKPIITSKIDITLELKPFLKETAHYNYVANSIKLLTDCGCKNDNMHITLFAKYKKYYFGYRNDSDISNIDIEP